MPHQYTENLLMSLYTIPSPARGSRGRDYADLLAKSRSGRRPGAAAPSVRAGLLAVSLTCAIGQAQDSESKSEEAVAVRNYISEQVGGLHNLQVPARNEDLPTPKQSDGSVAYRFETTEAKRFLGKLLFHDPVRTARVDINQGVPVDLPAGTAFGGTVSASDPNIQKIIAATKQTGSCGSCHIGEAAGKAGQVINFNVGGEGRGYTDEDGNFFARRRPQSILTKQRTAPIFPGDALVDVLPTLNDLDSFNGSPLLTTPAAFAHTPAPTALLETGRLDELDSVGRESPGLVGCLSCHSGPMLNKQNNDPDVAGIGAFVEENFLNVGIGDHPIQALAAQARGQLDTTKLGKVGFPYHAEDIGRHAITSDTSGASRFH